MTYRTILVSIDNSDSAHKTLSLAFSIAKASGAHVTVIHVRSDPKDTVPLLGEGMSVAMIEDMIEVSEREGMAGAIKAQDIFNTFVHDFGAIVSETPKNSGFSACLIEEIGREDEALASHGKLVDLIFAPRPTEDSEVAVNLALNAALFETGRPVLVVPPSGNTDFGKNIVISWNGSPQSSRAVASAMPILRQANTVTIFTVASDQISSDRIPALSEYLAWHGVQSNTEKILGPTHSVGPKLLEEISRVKADLLIMGAYTHSRVRRLILGGVTRHILEGAPIPVMMAH
ncbi:MAG: hypothetical protein CBB68_07985 [Rhodospirillaceae bacterium TMED8]|nr:universal stress protein UspA [Magnetovibrio sp.]OUT50915.1 MAG: hypothetical protein CBB68_07985 [Rhodospirillaceae bacterium TMED8]|tara:strand:+ start:6719 stop:7582 length:864 start_codon:yes stop_codon:yes gene_type:complete